MDQQQTWAGLDPDTHASREIRKASKLKDWPEGSTPDYRLKVADDDVDSESGLLFEAAGFDDPRKAVAYALSHFPREYGYGLYEVHPVINTPS